MRRGGEGVRDLLVTCSGTQSVVTRWLFISSSGHSSPISKRYAKCILRDGLCSVQERKMSGWVRVDVDVEDDDDDERGPPAVVELELGSLQRTHSRDGALDVTPALQTLLGLARPIFSFERRFPGIHLSPLIALTTRGTPFTR